MAAIFLSPNVLMKTNDLMKDYALNLKGNIFSLHLSQ